MTNANTRYSVVSRVRSAMFNTRHSVAANAMAKTVFPLRFVEAK
jgi:hypothetical protein